VAAVLQALADLLCARTCWIASTPALSIDCRSGRAGLKLLRKYEFPPDLQDAAVQNVLQQADALYAEWAR
jgi:hypothetical protein